MAKRAAGLIDNVETVGILAAVGVGAYLLYEMFGPLLQTLAAGGQIASGVGSAVSATASDAADFVSWSNSGPTWGQLGSDISSGGFSQAWDDLVGS